jgi:hypothetical protein
VYERLDRIEELLPADLKYTIFSTIVFLKCVLRHNLTIRLQNVIKESDFFPSLWIFKPEPSKSLPSPPKMSAAYGPMSLGDVQKFFMLSSPL